MRSIRPNSLAGNKAVDITLLAVKVELLVCNHRLVGFNVVAVVVVVNVNEVGLRNIRKVDRRNGNQIFSLVSHYNDSLIKKS